MGKASSPAHCARTRQAWATPVANQEAVNASAPGTEQGGDKKKPREGKPSKVIRDSFTMPLADYELLGVLKKRCLGLGIAIKKSELLRAGLATLERLPDASLTQVAAAVESVKTGRPPGKKKRKKNRKKKRKHRAKGKRR
ncbi:MAG TPA: hypothetical protein VF814_18085 [Casimicrobiaceae bacterium]